jgi:thiamine-phosphate pyrophosphorylase
MAIVDTGAAAQAGWKAVDLASAFLDGGATLLQIRAKDIPSAELLDLSTGIVRLAHAAGAAVIVNDRADVAFLSGADGVHVGQHDLAPNAVRTVVGADAIVGLSTHTLEQVEAALQRPVTYVAIGPVFGTATKVTGYNAVGVQRVRDAALRLAPSGLPLVAIGGITLDSALDVIRAGAACVAVISDLMATGDPAARVRAYLERLTV